MTFEELNEVSKLKTKDSQVVYKIASTQTAFSCSRLTIEILEQGVKYVQS